MATFAERLSFLRRRRGISQQELADYLNVNKQTISGYERGVRRPSGEHAIEVFEMLADYFNVDIAYLLGSADLSTYLAGPNDLDLSLTDEDKLVVEKYRKADTRTKRMVRYVLGIEDFMNGGEKDEM